MTGSSQVLKLIVLLLCGFASRQLTEAAFNKDDTTVEDEEKFWERTLQYYEQFSLITDKPTKKPTKPPKPTPYPTPHPTPYPTRPEKCEIVVDIECESNKGQDCEELETPDRICPGGAYKSLTFSYLPASCDASRNVQATACTGGTPNGRNRILCRSNGDALFDRKISPGETFKVGDSLTFIENLSCDIGGVQFVEVVTDPSSSKINFFVLKEIYGSLQLEACDPSSELRMNCLVPVTYKYMFKNVGPVDLTIAKANRTRTDDDVIDFATELDPRDLPAPHGFTNYEEEDIIDVCTSKNVKTVISAEGDPGNCRDDLQHKVKPAPSCIVLAMISCKTLDDTSCKNIQPPDNPTKQSCKFTVKFTYEAINIGSESLVIKTFNRTYNGDEVDLLSEVDLAVPAGKSASTVEKIEIDICMNGWFETKLLVEADSPRGDEECTDKNKLVFEVVTDQPTFQPSVMPSSHPSDSPSEPPSASPSLYPSASPSSEPTSSSSGSPTELPSTMPSSSPSQEPSESPTDLPSVSPSDAPSDFPSDMPSTAPSKTPSSSPSTSPSSTPSGLPSETPSVVPSETPTGTPSAEPSKTPSLDPSESPSQVPSLSKEPSSQPSSQPSETPSDVPSGVPSKSAIPSASPSESPTEVPSLSTFPSVVPSALPSQSAHPSTTPSSQPSTTPTNQPSLSTIPSSDPSTTPSSQPSSTPSMMPSVSLEPSSAPSSEPSAVPSAQPSAEPTSTPSESNVPTSSI